MPRWSWRFALAALLAVAFAAPSVAAAPLLTVGDVEQATGLVDLKALAKNASRDATGDMNFAGPGGKLVLTVTIVDAVGYAATRSAIARDVRGVGDEAYTRDGVPWALYVRSGKQFITLTTGADFAARPPVPTISQEALRALARLIASRM